MGEVTFTSSIEPAEVGSEGLALRWVFPDAIRPPHWLERTVTLGRDPTCEVVLPQEQVSRRHARVLARGPIRVIEDLQSKNGIRVNGQHVDTHVLEPGDVVRVGDTVAVVVRAPPRSDLTFRAFEHGIVGGFAHALAFEALKDLAPTSVPVTFEGAAGTGKRLFARALHELSGRRGAVVVVDCAFDARALTPPALFGSCKGAFGDAEQGYVRAADGGTLVLSGLAQLPLAVQPALRRAVERGEVLPLGAARAERVNVRFVAATELPLSTAVERGTLRADLAARVESAIVRLPALSACREIIPELFSAFCKRHFGYTPTLSVGFAEGLCLHAFSHNVRELDGLSRKLASLARRHLTSDLLADTLAQTTPPPVRSVSSVGLSETRESEAGSPAELEALQAALGRHAGNLAKAAGELAMTRQRAFDMLQRASGGKH